MQICTFNVLHYKMVSININITWSLDGFARLVAGLEQAYSIPVRDQTFDFLYRRDILNAHVLMMAIVFKHNNHHKRL